MEQEVKAWITDIFWDRVFLTMIIESKEEKKEVYLSSKSDCYAIGLERVEDSKYRARINITNIKDGNMLKNENYMLKIQNEKNILEAIPMTSDVGYKLENLDKVYRYYKECYAYTVNFEVKQIANEQLSFVLKSRYMKLNRKPDHHCRTLKTKGNTSQIKIGVKNILEMFLNGLYHFFSVLHFHKQNHILLMSETRSPISGNLKALDARLKERNLDKTYHISYSFSKTLEERYSKLIFKWIKLLWIISKQSFVFIDDYSPLFKFINLSDKTKLIQVWHAGVGFKSVGYARFGFGGPEPMNSCHRKYDYAIVGSKALIPVYEEVFGIDKKRILPFGLPRLDGYLEENHIQEVKQHLYEDYPILKDKTVILFAPTFRGEGQKQAYYPYKKLDLEAIFQLCEEKNAVFIVKMHPFVKRKIEIPEEYQGRIQDFSDYGEINDLFYVTDILITDYSSNVYDFSLLGKPILFYTFDLDKYQLTNRIQRPVKEYAPGKVCMKFEEVILAIQNEDFEIEKLQKYREENFDDIGKNASDLIIDHIILKGEKDDKKDSHSGC